MKRAWCVVLAIVLALVCSSCVDRSPARVSSDAIVFVNVNVIPMDGERVIGDQTVVIDGGRIISVEDSARARVPSDATRIDASGHYLIPGLSDMHIHLEGDAWNVLFPTEAQFPVDALNWGDLLFPYVANGVTMVQVMSALPEHVEVRKQVADGGILGPRLLLARMIDGPEKAWPPPLSTWVASPEEARQAVLDAGRTGYDSVKVYSFLDPESYATIVATAREVDLGVVGHIPLKLSLEEVLAAGQDLIAHVEEVKPREEADFGRDHIDHVAQLIAASDTWVTPTLTTSRHILAVLDDFDSELARPEARYLQPMALSVWSFINEYLYQPIPDEHRKVIERNFEEFQRPLTLALHRAGGRLMTGSDALIPSNVPGFGIHDELMELVGVGLTPYEALRASTTLPHEFLGELDGAGTIEVGKRADLVLLKANPLDDIANTRSIRGVVIGGRWLSDDDIRQGFDGLAASGD